MKKTNLILATLLLLTVACTNEDVSKKDHEQNDDQSLTTFQSGDIPSTRTTMDHTLGGGGKFFWETGDNIWVDKGGTLVASTSSDITGKTKTARFQLSGSFPNSSYPVYYTGKGSTSGDEVTIATSQTQSVPNDFSHLGVSGDCGAASATNNGTTFFFQLEHKAAYLCFLPRSANDVIANCTLTKIEVTSDNPIAGTYDFTGGTLAATPKSNSSNTITLTTGASGFPLNNTATDILKNGAYMVIAPGTHTLMIRYWVKSAVDNIEATVTKYVQGTFAPNTVSEIKSKLDNSYNNVKYYMWDAQQDLWAGLESIQPTTVGASASTGLTRLDGSPRNSGHIYGVPYGGDTELLAASHTFKDQPNNNEVRWYATAGDWYMDTKEAVVLMGHLYRGGFWCKKRAHIPGFNSTTAPAGYSGWGPVMTEGRPAYQDLDKYFYLPNLGKYSFNWTFDDKATFQRGDGIWDFLAWCSGVEDCVGIWNTPTGDHYALQAMGFYSGFASNSLYTHSMNEMLEEDCYAAPIYHFE